MTRLIPDWQDSDEPHVAAFREIMPHLDGLTLDQLASIIVNLWTFGLYSACPRPSQAEEAMMRLRLMRYLYEAVSLNVYPADNGETRQ